MPRTRLLLALLAAFAALALAQPVVAQPALGVYRDTLVVADSLGGDTLRVRPFVVPPTFRLLRAGAPLPDSAFALDARSGRITLPGGRPGDTLVAVYQTLGLDALNAPRTRRRLVAEPDSAGVRRAVEARDDEPLLAAVPGLRRSGAITRGIVAGNNRDVSIESGLRMELAGEVAPGVEVQAVLTDESTPIQPEGTTQRLADLDRVYVQLDSDYGRARLGDVDLLFTGTEFAPFQRKVQGVAVAAPLPAAGALRGGRAQAAASVARGRFRQQDVLAVEGVQGPYRLTTDEGEPFPIVLAGSERVYLNGALMTRGEAADYVVDYATGEVTFTSRRLITVESRISVEFEYATVAFTRALLAAEGEARGPGRSRVRVTALRETDGSDFPEAFGLTAADLDSLAAAGDRPYVRESAQRVPFDPQSPFVPYVRRDTTLGGVTYPYFAPAPPDAAEVFQVRFSRVAPGAGQYRRAGQVRNGLLYEWVGPFGGDYAPFREVPAPQAHTLLDVAVAAEAVRGLEAWAEGARSHLDRNRLSDLDSADDGGGAYAGGLRLRRVPLAAGRLSATAEFRLREATFRSFDRIRPVEFNRRWNLARAGSGAPGLDTLAERSAQAAVRWEGPGADSLRRATLAADGGWLDLGGRFEGWRGGAAGRVFAGAWEGEATAEYVASEDRLPRLGTGLDGPLGQGDGPEDGRWLRALAAVRRPTLGGRLVPEVAVERERRAQARPGSDSLVTSSIAFWEVRPGARWAAGAVTAALGLGWRDEQRPLDGRFADAARAVTVSAEGAYEPAGPLRADARAGYRRRTVTEAFRLLGEGDVESVAVGGTLRAAPLGRAVDLALNYEGLTERAAVRQEVFLLVGPELGEYVWVDEDGDGVPQLGEFVPETTELEGEYVRQFVPGDDLEPTATVRAQGTVGFSGERAVPKPAPGWRGFVRGLTARTTVEVREESRTRDLLRVFLLDPAVLQVRDSVDAGGVAAAPTTLAGRFRVGQEIGLLRDRPGGGARVLLNHLTSTSQLAAGLDTRLVQSARVEGTWRAGARWSVSGAAERGRNRAGSAAIASRRYDILRTALEGDLTWQATGALALTLAAEGARNRDREAAGREATVLRVPVQARVAVPGRLSVLLRAERADVSLTGAAAGLAQYELTEGRGPGTSYLWRADVQATVNRFLRAHLTYDGRAPEDAPVIHTVRMSLSAVF